jgi:hypothetical protein
VSFDDTVLTAINPDEVIAVNDALEGLHQEDPLTADLVNCTISVDFHWGRVGRVAWDVESDRLSTLDIRACMVARVVRRQIERILNPSGDRYFRI